MYVFKKEKWKKKNSPLNIPISWQDAWSPSCLQGSSVISTAPPGFFCFWGRHILNSLPFLTHPYLLNPYPFHESHWRFLPMKCSDLFSSPVTFLGHWRLALSPTLSDTIASWSMLACLTPPSWASPLWSHHYLCSLPEQTVLDSRVKSPIPADTTSLLSLPLHIYRPTRHVEFPILWVPQNQNSVSYCPFLCHPSPQVFPLAYFSTLLHPAQKPRLAQVPSSTSRSLELQVVLL